MIGPEKIPRLRRQLLVILGGIAGGAIVSETIKRCAAAGAAIELLGYLNDAMSPGTNLAGHPVLGRFEQRRECAAEAKFISAIMKPREARTRFARIRSLDIPYDRWATVMDPTAIVTSDASVGCGSFVGAGSIVESGAVVGNHCHLRANCYLSHDVKLGDFVSVGPHATVLGRSMIGEGAHFGANSVCRDGILIGRYALVGVGAVVTGDVPDFTIVAGNPARSIGQVDKRSDTLK
ncbi:MAG TPA: DapH/DapD/GlmU-related protein [Nitrospira sp.]|nr:DapH/DapD/GlmU-related protein [Nitrospira sp.]